MLGLIFSLVFFVAGLFAWHAKDMYTAFHLFGISAAFYFCWQIASINTNLTNFNKTLFNVFKKKEETK